MLAEKIKNKVKEIINKVIKSQDLFTRVEENIRENAVSKRIMKIDI